MLIVVILQKCIYVDLSVETEKSEKAERCLPVLPGCLESPTDLVPQLLAEELVGALNWTVSFRLKKRKLLATVHD